MHTNSLKKCLVETKKPLNGLRCKAVVSVREQRKLPRLVV